MHRSRQIRSSYLKESLLSDPGWGHVAGLVYQQDSRPKSFHDQPLPRRQYASSDGAQVDRQATPRSLLQRAAAHDDARVQLVEITPKGFQQMRRFIVDSVTRFNMPMPIDGPD
jgi:hypothetical protein